MKFIGKIPQPYFLLLVLALLFNSCAKDGMIEVAPKTLPEYIAQMGPFVNSELPIVRNSVVGYDKNNYSVSLNAVTATALTTVKAAYLVALKADSALIVSPTVTITQLVMGNLTLGAPGKVFWTGINFCDKRPLNDAIVAANALNASTLAGTTTGTVLAAAKTTYTTAIAAAVTTRDAVTTTIDRQVTTSIATLSEATNAFKTAIIK
jgi:hypothetical protein